MKAVAAGPAGEALVGGGVAPEPAPRLTVRQGFIERERGTDFTSAVVAFSLALDE